MREIELQRYGTPTRGSIHINGVKGNGAVELLEKISYGYRGKTYIQSKNEAEAKVQEYKEQYSVTRKGNYETL